MRTVNISVLTLTLLLPNLEAQPQPEPVDPRTIRLKTGRFDPLTAGPVLPSSLRIAEYAPGTRGTYLVQFDRPVTGDDTKALESAGAAVKGYVPMSALEVVMTPESVAAVQELPGIRWVGIYQPGHKLFPGLLREVQAMGQSMVELQVSLYPGEEGPVLGQIAALGARILKIDRGRSFVLTQVEFPAARLVELARLPLVRYIEATYDRSPVNDRARLHIGLTDVADDTFTAGLDPSLDGNDEITGFQVKYGHFDTGLESSHPDFDTADVTLEPGADSSDASDGHGTHTAGSIVGDGGEYPTVPEAAPGSGTISQGEWRGITPEAALHHISFENGYSDRQIFERESEEGAHISSNSWGYCTPFFCNPITDYNTNAAVWDEGVWDADDDVPGLQSLVVFFSAGNGGGFNSPYDGCSSNGPDNVGSPGTAKNVITVGNNETDRGAGSACDPVSGLGDNIEEVNSSSSRGPVDPDGTGQGLFKPDVVNIGGYWVASTEATETASACDPQFVLPDCPTYCSDTGPSYAYNNGTSMSCPLTAGLGGVLYQDLVVNRSISSPKPSLIKALLINGSRDLQPSACDYTFEADQTEIHEGWGFVQAKDSLYGPGGNPGQRNVELENEVTANAVATGEQYQRQVNVNPGIPFKVTLAWTDYPASPGTGSPLVVNDLDLEVSGPDGTFLGNNFLGNWSVTGGTPDRYNVVENVYIENPAGGTYTITVKGFQISQDQEPDKGETNQDFSLVWSGLLSQQTCNSNADCDDTLVCNGAETCVAGTCQPGTPMDCDDDVSCTVDSCNEGTGLCDKTPDDGLCDNGLFCDGAETCDPSLDCQAGGGDPCPGGTTCNEATETCDTPACDNDGTCEAGEDCNNCPNDCRQKSNGNPKSRYCCDGDLSGCGDSRCSESGWSCVGGGCTSDPECDDGLFCNGTETCSGGTCQGGSDPCPGQSCDEGSDQCVSCAGNKDPCESNSDCCSNNCKNGSCRGN